MRTTVRLTAIALLAGLFVSGFGQNFYGIYDSVHRLKAYFAENHKKAKEEGRTFRPGYMASWLYYIEQRAFPFDEVDWKAIEQGALHRDAMPTEAGIMAAQWEYFGPRNLPVPYRIYYGQGNIIGRLSSVAYHPGGLGRYFLTSGVGGLWKTENFGADWTPMSDDWTYMRTSSVAIHPINHNTIYVGTGDFPGGGGYGQGILRSMDGGQTWTAHLVAESAGRSVSKVLIHPEQPNIILATVGRRTSTNGNVYRSTDGGDTWQMVIATSAVWSHISYSRINPSTNRRYFYVSGHSNGGEIWRSSDDGATWTKLTTPMSSAFQSSVRVAASPNNHNNVYIISGVNRNIWRSTDAGVNWTSIVAGFPNGSNNYNWSQHTYDMFLDVGNRNDGSTTDVIYVGLIDIVQSPDGGATWQSLGQTYTNSALTHNDHHAIAINRSNPSEALVGNDGGIFPFNWNSGSNLWNFNTTNNRRLGITQFYKSAFHPTDPNRLLGGTQDNATPQCSGNLDVWRNVGGGDGGFCMINPSNPSIQYATSQNLNIYRTANDWSSSNTITPSFGSDRRGFIAPIQLSYTNPNLLYAGSNYLWRWSETSQSWTARLGSQELSVSGYVNFIGISPSNGNYIYTGSNQGELWMTSNAGTNWTQINTGSPSLPSRAITCVVVDPTTPTRIWVTVSGTGTGHVWRCDNTAAVTRVWVDVSGSGLTGLPDVPANTVQVEPGNTGRLYVGTDVGVFYTRNGGATWYNGTRPFGLPNVQVNDLKLVAGTGYLNAATWGRGMWRMRLPFNPLGDIDGNGCVDDADLARLLTVFGSTAGGSSDLNGDGIVDDTDLAILLENFGNGC